MCIPKLLLVIAHPRYNSFNYKLAEEVIRWSYDKRLTIFIHDLYADGFNPVLSAEESNALHQWNHSLSQDPLVSLYQSQLKQADILVVIHPNWWGKPPALLAGWLDRVLAPDVAYKLPHGAAGMPQALLSIKCLAVTTGDTPIIREKEVFGDPLDLVWNHCVFPFIGGIQKARVHFSPVSISTGEQRQRWIKELRGILETFL